MASYYAMQCDSVGCNNTTQQTTDLTGWWAVEADVLNAYEHPTIVIAQMVPQDFTDSRQMYFCCMNHAQVYIAEVMCSMQEYAIKIQRELVAADGKSTA